MMKNYLPESALYILRYHSFYPQHRENAYEHLMDKHDKKCLNGLNYSIPTICIQRTLILQIGKN